jgi:hypothetical protein
LNTKGKEKRDLGDDESIFVDAELCFVANYFTLLPSVPTYPGPTLPDRRKKNTRSKQNLLYGRKQIVEKREESDEKRSQKRI